VDSRRRIRSRSASSGNAPRGRVAPWKKLLIAAGLTCFIAAVFVFVYFWVSFSTEIDARLSGQVFNRASLVFSTPIPISVGEQMSAQEVAGRLRKGLYAEGAGGSKVGTYTVEGDRLEIRPGPLSYFADGANRQGAATVKFEKGQIASISSSGQKASSYLLEPELITTLFDQTRTKRRVVRYQDLPPVLVNAVLAAEDRRFFSHHGVNIYRIFDAAFKDLRADEPLQGGSTLTMQLARNFFLTPQRTIRRKVAEIFLALMMEQRLSKEQIFELYANEVYLGQRGSFSVDGFAAASNAYFNKDVKSLTASEAALLAGLIRGPNLYSPYRHPQQALRVRNYVLREMQQDGFITPAEARQASEAPLGIAPQNVEGSQAPFFVDMVKDQLLEHFTERDLLSQSYRVYTTLDPDLQRAASDAVKAGMEEVDQQLNRRRRPKNAPPRDPNQPQVAAVVLDPHSGEVRALVGGRDYAVSQLNHAMAKRQPGSSFKPFVYAAALSSAVDGSDPLVTPATVLVDEPTSFTIDDKVYQPRNYKDEYHGPVTLREALAYSLNCATVSLAQMIGYEKVRNLAIQAGINNGLEATPALALGSYDATPLEIAGAYTIFSNAGDYRAPRMILSVRDGSGQELWKPEETERQVLDPRVAYQMVNLLETVVDHGTGAGVRSRGFTLPAAGKTGTSHDGWFAGFTTNLLAVVWVGYDDNHELGLPGANSALPVWTDFMKAATALPDYRDAREFTEPPGLVTAQIQLPSSPEDSQPLAAYPDEIFIDGTQPRHGLAVLSTARNLFSRLLHLGEPSDGGGRVDAHPAPVTGPAAETQRPAAVPGVPDAAVPPASPKKKPNVLKRFFSIFKGGSGRNAGAPPTTGEDNPGQQ
jgi:penicillin-binding protein 1B